jgi:ABC-2 type transport system permease protein
LWPFAALTAPMFAPWPLPYLVALGGAALVTAALTAWVIASDGVFQEATAEVAARRGQQSATAGTARYKVRSAGWALAALGRPELAFAWKGAMQTLRTVDKRSIFRMVAFFFSVAIASASLGRSAAPATILGAFSLMATVFMIVLGPQVLRSDMREDLAHLAVLRTWPIKASAVVRGELIWPGALITLSAWTTLAVAAYLSGITLGDLSLELRLSAAAAIAFVAPSLVFAQLTILNAIALMFPAWVPLGSQRARGLDAMGQRLIMMGGTWLLMVVALLPGAIVGGTIWFALRQFIGHGALIPAAVVCTVIVGIEVLLATEALGPVYERLDVMAVEQVE